jgi:hypothetical protein
MITTNATSMFRAFKRRRHQRSTFASNFPTTLGPAYPIVVIEDDCTVADTDRHPVWVKLVIDGDDSYDAFEIYEQIPENVGRLKEAIVNQTPELSSRSIGPAWLLVYLAGTNVLVPKDVKPLRPGLPLADLDFSEITDETPLIVTAKSRQQQQATEVSLFRAIVHRQFALRKYNVTAIGDNRCTTRPTNFWIDVRLFIEHDHVQRRSTF